MNAKSLAILEHNEVTAIAKPGRLDQSPALVYLGKLTPKARRVQADALNVIANVLQPGADYMAIPWERIEYQHAQKIRADLTERYSAASVNRILSALRETAKQAWLLGFTSADQYLRIAQVERVRGSTIPAGRELTSGEVKALISVCMDDNTPAGYRDAAIIAWMVSSGGPRRHEVPKVDLNDFDPVTGLIKLTGKGNKQRTNYIENGALDAMLDWLQVRGAEPGPLFTSINKSGRLSYEPMTDQAIYGMLQKRGKQAGIKDFSPHDLRRTFISDMLEAGADIATVAKLAGHSNVTTTARYDRRPEQAKKKATQRLTVPYIRRLPC